jgi:hypothetical protein
VTPFYFTFGQRFRTEPHPAAPALGIHIHPDGYVTVMADSERVARDVANKVLHGQWCMSNVHKPPEKFFPLGNLKTIE